MNRFVRSSGQPSQPQFANIATPLSQTRGRARASRVNIAGLHSNVGLQHAATLLEGGQAECLKNCDILRYDSSDYASGENSKLATEPRVRLEHQYCSSLHSERLMANEVGGSPELPSRREASFETFTLGEGSAENGTHLGALKAHAPVVLPPFWDVDADLWFVTAENIFRLHNIKLERDRYELTLGSLDLRHLQKVRHVLQDLHGEFSYFQLKEALMRTYSTPRSKQIDELLHRTALGDRQPTELLAHMRELLGTRDAPELFRKLFMDKLPPDVRKIVVASHAESLDELVERADRVLAEDTSASSGQSFRHRTQPETADLALHGKIDALVESLNQLTVAQNQETQHRFQHSRPTRRTNYAQYPSHTSNTFSRLPINSQQPINNSFRTRNTFASHPTPSPLSQGYCFYHTKFGQDARKCQPPCSWAPNSNQSQETHQYSNRCLPSTGSLFDKFESFFSPLLFIKDPLTSIDFLIDTGSSKSLLPCDQSSDPVCATGKMLAANDSEINLFETVPLTVSLGTGKPLPWQFRKASIRHPIIGMDFLRHYGLAIDPLKGCLLKLASTEQEARIEDIKLDSCNQPKKENPLLPVDSVPTKDSLENLSIPSSIEELLISYSSLFDLTNFRYPHKHKTQHHIETVGPPVASRVRRLSPEKMVILKREINKLLDLGVLEPSDSDYASPVHLVPKKNGEYRVTGDFRLLNKQTKPDKYPIPFLTDFVDEIAGSRVFSSLDLYKSYYQLELAPSSVHKTAMCTPIGLFAYKRLAMGMKNSQACMAKFMNEVLRGLNFVFCYIDDILIFSKDLEEHRKHLALVFKRLGYYGLVLNKEKCIFAAGEITFLGHHVSENGVAPLESKVEAVRNFTKPSTMKGLRRFLGMVNFYRRFLPGAAKAMAPLHALLSPNKVSRKPIEWNELANESFCAIKQKLAEATMLATMLTMLACT